MTEQEQQEQRVMPFDHTNKNFLEASGITEKMQDDFLLWAGAELEKNDAISVFVETLEKKLLLMNPEFIRVICVLIAYRTAQQRIAKEIKDDLLKKIFKEGN